MDRRAAVKTGAISAGVALGGLVAVLGVPPIRDWFFSHKVWPFRLPWDITPHQLDKLRALAEPGDLVIERNLHSFHWMLFCKASTGSTWVHAAMVDEDETTGEKKLISMFKFVQVQDFSFYLEKGSTDVVLLRPPYPSKEDRKKALDFARSQIGTEFDPNFDNRAGNCVGLIAAALEAGGVHVRRHPAFGFLKEVDTAWNLLHVEGIQKIWSSREDREEPDDGDEDEERLQATAA